VCTGSLYGAPATTVSRPEMRPFGDATVSPPQQLSGFATASSEPTLVPDEEWLQEILQRLS
jgi:hypothetical protein